MKKTVLFVLGAGVFAAGCDYHPDSGWRENCEVNASYDSYEYARCLDGVAHQAESPAAASAAPAPEPAAVSVTIDPDNANRPGREDLGKGRIE